MTDADNAEPPASPSTVRASPHAYPMLLDVTGRRVVLVGGGAVALRKAKGLIDAGARPELLRVVAPDHRDGFPRGVIVIAEEYRAEHLNSAQLVFAATDSAEVNRSVVRDARRLGILVCRVDADDDADAAESQNDPAGGDFITPAKFVNGPVTVTVATGGSAALAAMIRDELGRRFDERWALLAAAMQTLRPEIRRHPRLSSNARRAIFRELASAEALDVIGGRDHDGAAALRAWLKQRHPEL